MVIDTIGKTIKKIRKKQLLDDVIEVKINSKEKILFEKYAEIKEIELDDLIKGLVRKNIDEFIKG